jgi:hypothetical protein
MEISNLRKGNGENFRNGSETHWANKKLKWEHCWPRLRLVFIATKIFAFYLAIVILLFFPGFAAPSQTLQRNADERELFELLNRERSAQKLPELQWDDALFKAARQHALLMLKLKAMEHQFPGEPTVEERLAAAGAHFTYIAENVAIGSNAQSIHTGWMNSPGHRKNILNPRVTAVGIAAVGENGGLFAVQDFSQLSSDLTLEQQEKQVASLLAGRGLHVTSGSQDSRKACYSNVAGPSRTGSVTTVMTAYSVLRFETTDLSVLPPEVDKKIRSAPYRNVAVGACEAGNSGDFTQYRIALVLY